MSTWKERLAAKKVLIADGAWGTELSLRGLAAGESPEKWNLDHPDDVRAVADSYVQAGADIILSNSFGGNRFKLTEAHLADHISRINQLAAELSKQAAGDKAFVFASMGPTGQFLAPLGTVSEKEIIACFAEQAQALAAGGADGIVIETMTDLAEAQAALKAVKQNTPLPAAVSLTFDKGARGYATMMGVKPPQAAEQLTAAGADLVGANCGAGIENMIEIAKLMRPATALPLWFKPNAGLPELIDGKTVFRQTPDIMAQYLPALIDAGAGVIGGCCGTTPQHIRLLATETRKLTNS